MLVEMIFDDDGDVVGWIIRDSDPALEEISGVWAQRDRRPARGRGVGLPDLIEFLRKRFGRVAEQGWSASLEFEICRSRENTLLPR